MRREAPQPPSGRPRDRGRPMWSSLGSVLLLSGVLALTAFTVGGDGTDPGRYVVGELKLADDDEGSRDRVHGTFTGDNLAPGDRVESTVTFLREPPPDPVPATLEPRLDVRLEGAESQLGASLEVVTLRYGQADLLPKTRAACGDPISLARLAACTEEPPHPLYDLEDPTPGGTDLSLDVEFVPRGSPVQGASTSFDVTASLKARPAAVSQQPGLDVEIEQGSDLEPVSSDTKDAEPGLGGEPCDLGLGTDVMTAPGRGEIGPWAGRGHQVAWGVLLEASLPGAC